MPEQSHRENGSEIFCDPEIESCTSGEVTRGGSWKVREADILRDIACAKEEIRSGSTLGLSNTYAFEELERLATRLEDARSALPEVSLDEIPPEVVQEFEDEPW